MKKHSLLKKKIDQEIDQEIEALSIITGLPSRFLGQDRSISMEWYEMIIPRLINEDMHREFTISTYARLLNVGFSKKIIAVLNFNDPDQEMFSFQEIICILIKYAINLFRKDLIRFDQSIFPRLNQNGSTFNNWQRSPLLDVPYMFNTKFSYTDDALPKLINFQNLDETAKFHFHGTSWKVAHEIAKDGICLERVNNKYTDFGYNSFHVYDNFAVALDIALKKFAGYAALLCYSFESFDESMSKSFTSPNNDWQMLVFQFRCTSSRSYRDDMKKFDIISGPICARATDFIEQISDVVPLTHNGDVVIQTAVRNREIALQMDSKLSGLIFFSP